MKCSLNPDGTVKSAVALYGNPLLEIDAVNNVKKWKFNYHGDKPKESTIVLNYNYYLVGRGTRGRPRVCFVFQMPLTVIMESQRICSDHIPCREDGDEFKFKCMYDVK